MRQEEVVTKVVVERMEEEVAMKVVGFARLV